MAFVHANGHGIPISFPIADEGFCIVTAFRLSLRFQFEEESMQIDQEIFHDASGELTHIVSQPSYLNDGVKFWRLPPGRFRLYGLSNSLLAGSTEILTPRQSSTSMHNSPRVRTVKIEPGLEPIHLLSDDSDDDTPTPVPPLSVPLSNPSNLHFLGPLNHPGLLVASLHFLNAPQIR